MRAIYALARGRPSARRHAPPHLCPLRGDRMAAPPLQQLPPSLPQQQMRGLASAGSAAFQCSDCGQSYAKWQGQCSSCASWGSVAPAPAASAPRYAQANALSFSKAKKPSTSQKVAWGGAHTTSSTSSTAVRMKDVAMDTMTERIQLPDRELNWVFGGGLVAGSLTLIAGNPGVGKSTIALQIANMLADTAILTSPALDPPLSPSPRRVLYVSGEESVLQLKMRAERLGAISDTLFVAAETNVDAILQLIETVDDHVSAASSSAAFDAVVIDSIQTIFAEDIASPAGTVNQVKECTLRLLRLAKQRHVPVLVIGHVTKSGDIAGPKVLEHIVDTVVQLEGDPQSARRFLRCHKNRFGNTSEVGVFAMRDDGLHALTDPLHAFVSPTTSSPADEARLDGASLTIAMEGSRPIPLEIQALATPMSGAVSSSSSSSSSFTSGAAMRGVRGVGVGYDKLQLLFAVLHKRAGVSLAQHSVFVNVAEGYSIQEPVADVALAVALASAVSGRPVRRGAVFLGELSLSGHLRPVKMLAARLTAAHKIGLRTAVVPTLQCADTKRALLTKFAGHGLAIREADTLLEALQIAFRAEEGEAEAEGGPRGAVR